jgi:hypothetical protein
MDLGFSDFAIGKVWHTAIGMEFGRSGWTNRSAHLDAIRWNSISSIESLSARNTVTRVLPRRSSSTGFGFVRGTSWSVSSRHRRPYWLVIGCLIFLSSSPQSAHCGSVRSVQSSAGVARSLLCPVRRSASHWDPELPGPHSGSPSDPLCGP